MLHDKHMEDTGLKNQVFGTAGSYLRGPLLRTFAASQSVRVCGCVLWVCVCVQREERRRQGRKEKRDTETEDVADVFGFGVDVNPPLPPSKLQPSSIFF